MKRGLTVVMALLVLLLSGCSNTTEPETKDLRLSSNYEITAALDPYNNILEYTARIQISNNGRNSTDELYFHLYGNLYKTESEGIEIISVTDEKEKAVPFTLKDDNQLILLTLGDPLNSGEEATLLFTGKVIIPVMANIFGVARDGEIHLPFFYPQLAFYDKDGWNTKPLAQVGDGRYLATSDYMLTIQAPSEYEIVCNGMELSRDSLSGQTTYVFQADQRRELFIAASTGYVHLERIVGNTRILGYFNEQPYDSPTVMDDMNSVMDAAAFSLEYYNRVFMEYPYETLIIVRSAWAVKSAINSMEYSGLFTIAAMGDDNGEHTTYHEMAHQWFYFLVSNNENAEPWLDEAFAEFASILCWEAAGYTEIVADWWDFYRTVTYVYEEGKAINVSYDEADNYSNLFYCRGAYFLKELMDAIGKDEFLSILSEYCETYANKIVTTEDFISLLRERTPVDVDDIIDEYIVSNSPSYGESNTKPPAPTPGSAQSTYNNGTAIVRDPDNDTEPSVTELGSEGFALVLDGNTSVDNTLRLTSEYQYFYIKVVNTGSSTISMTIGNDSSSQSANFYQIPTGTYCLWSTEEWPATSQAVSLSSSNGMSGKAYAYLCSTLTESETHS